MANIALITNNILTDSGTPLTSIPSGTGTTNYLSKWTSSSTLNNSLLYDDGTNVGIGTTTPSYTLDVNGNLRAITSGIVGNAAAFSGGFGGLMSVRKDLDITAGGTYRNAQLAVGSTTNNGALLLGYSTTGIGSIQAAVMGVSYSSLSIQGFGGNLMVGTTTDAGYKLDVNGTLRAQGKLTITTGGTEITGTAVLYSGAQSYGQVQIFSGSAFQMFNGANNSKASFQYINANGLLLTTNSDNISGVLKGLQVNPTMVAAANNDVLVGLDITPTFTNGAYTGITNLGLRVNSGVSLFSGNVVLNGTNLYFGSNLGNVVIRPVQTTNFQIFNNNSGATLYLNANGSVQIGQSNATNWATFSASGHTIYGTTNTSFFSSGNVGINQGTDAGYKLDVNGTARINSTLALTSSTYAGTFSFYLSAANTLIGNSSNIGNWLQVGGGNRVYITGQEFNSTSRGNIFGNTVGGEAISATTIIAQSSGTTATTGLSLRYTINNTGTYVGISRGIYYNPTITSLTGTTHRAIETVTGDVIFGSTSGVVGIGTTSLSTEANLYLGAKSTSEGGQIILQKGTSQTYATHLDNYNNQFRVMVGTDTGSTAAQLIVMHATGNVLINSGTDNGYKLQVAGNTYVSGVTATSSLNVQNAADVNSNEGSNDLLVYADLTSGVDVLYGGGKVKANIYTTPVITPKTINPSSTVAFMKWYPTTSQGVFIDYVLYIDSGTEMRSGTVTIVNDTSGNAQLLDTKTADLNGSTANITFAVVNNGGTMEFQVTNSGAAPAYMNILTRYIPTIF